MPYSYSSLKTYKTCPLKYRHVYILKDVKDTTSFEADYGSRAHKRLEEYVRKVPEDQLSKPVVRLEDLAFCTAVADRVMRKADQVAAELRTGVTESMRATGFFSNNVWLRGVIDLLAIRGEGAWIGDWKFGKRRPDMQQLDMFALHTFVNFPTVQKITASFVWAHDKALDTKTFVRDDVPYILDAIKREVEMVETSVKHDNWPVQPSALCGWCPCTKAQCIYGQPVKTGGEEE